MDACAYILYCPSRKGIKPRVFFDSQALSILANAESPSGDSTLKPPDIPSLSARWQTLLDSKNGEPISIGEPSPDGEILEVLQSKRRRYAVRGIRLSSYSSNGPHQQHPTNSYLFILERILPDRMNLAMTFRQYHLSPREQEVVRLLLEGHTNKDIAEALGLSLNTVKGYLKLLTRKLGVCSRTGILSCFISGSTGGFSKKLPLS